MRAVLIGLTAAVLLLFASVACAEELAISGSTFIGETLLVKAGDTLRVSPGVVLTFNDGCGIRVEGVLEINGKPEAPVTLRGDGWSGLLSAPDSILTIDNAVLEGAAVAIEMAGGRLHLDDTLIRGCPEGVSVGTMAEAEISGTTISGASRHAVSVRQDARLAMADSKIEGAGGTGVSVVAGCSVTITGTVFEGLKMAVRSTYPGSRPKLHSCLFKFNEYGLYSEYPGSGAVVDRCTFTDNEYAVYARRLSSPEIMDTEISRNIYGVYATEGSSPKVIDSKIRGNDYGVYVTLSSYPVINYCDLSENTKFAAYLDVQSYEWVSGSADETRSRNMGMRAAAMAAADDGKKGGTARDGGMDSARYVNPKGAFVDFTKNYWGETALGEIRALDEPGDLSVIYDYFDLGSDVYEGDRWERDKVDYSGYLDTSPHGE